MTKAEIEQTLVDLLKELQVTTGECACVVTAATVPLRDLSFFDSLLALETTVVLEERLGAAWDQDSVFTEKDGARPLTIAEIAARLAANSGAAA
jgi:hypothetical protein